MVRNNIINGGNGDGKLRVLEDSISQIKERCDKGPIIGMGESGGRRVVDTISGGLLSLDLVLMARLGVTRSFSLYGSKERELLVSCPTCKTFETLWFKGDVLIPTKRFIQGLNKRVYHNCGSYKPCQLLPKFAGEWSAATMSLNLPPYLIKTTRLGAETAVCVAH